MGWETGVNTFEILQEVVDQTMCKPGWSFRLVRLAPDHAELLITVHGRDSSKKYDRSAMISVAHPYLAPPATYNRETWRRWVFEMCRKVENHELGEWFRVGNEQPFLPLHGPGEDPYTVHEFRPETDALITQDGSMRESYRE